RSVRPAQGQDFQFWRKLLRFVDPIKDKARGADDQARAIALLTFVSSCLEQREGLESLTQPHFVRQNSAEAVSTQKMQPGDALFLVRPKNIFQSTQWRTFDVRFTTERSNTILPCRRRLHLPFGMLLERCIKKARLRIIDPISAALLFGRAIEQHL